MIAVGVGSGISRAGLDGVTAYARNMQFASPSFNDLVVAAVPTIKEMVCDVVAGVVVPISGAQRTLRGLPFAIAHTPLLKTNSNSELCSFDPPLPPHGHVLAPFGPF